MRIFLIIQALTVLTVALFLLINAKQNSVSFALGGFLITANIFLSAWVWRWVLQKKLIALAITLIVFKYAILVITIFKLLNQVWIDPLWFCLGLGSFTVSSLIYAVAVGTKKDVI